MAEGKFATAINCMDGRVQEPVIKWMKEHCQVEYGDMITEPGPDGIMAKRFPEAVAAIKNRVLVSVEKHGSEAVALVAHGDCAGNPVSEEEHLGHLRRGMELIRSWDLPVDIAGLWVDVETGRVDAVAVITRD